MIASSGDGFCSSSASGEVPGPQCRQCYEAAEPAVCQSVSSCSDSFSVAIVAGRERLGSGASMPLKADQVHARSCAVCDAFQGGPRSSLTFALPDRPKESGVAWSGLGD
jgi:hypothetical protein